MTFKVNAISFNAKRNVNVRLITRECSISKCAPIKIGAQHVFKNFEMSRISIKYLNFIDKITPYLDKHSCIKKICMYIGEQLVKLTNNI